MTYCGDERQTNRVESPHLFTLTDYFVQAIIWEYDFPITKLTDASQFIDYKADIEQPLPMIYQSGYLTIKDCNIDRNTYLLDIPNEEVRNGFIEIIKQIDDKGYAKPYAADNRKLIALGINFSSEKGTIDGFMTKEL